MGHGFNGGFVHSHPVGFPLRRQKEAKPLIAARHLCLEGFSPCVGAAPVSYTHLLKFFPFRLSHGGVFLFRKAGRLLLGLLFLLLANQCT